MNCTREKTFDLPIPPELAGRRLTDLISGKPLGPASTCPVAPGTTVVLCLSSPE